MINPAVISFTVSELLAIHDICDTHSIPRENFGEKLSVSQRVALLAGSKRC